MHYHFSYQFPQSHFLQIEMTIPKVSGQYLELQLPAWRPGRYELANYAQNIAEFSVADEKGQELPFQKVKKDRWRVQCKQARQVVVRYNYFAAQMDAGGSWLDDEQLYINFVNCALAVVGKEKEACTISLQVPENYEVATSLEQKGKKWHAKDYYELVDAPLIASATLQYRTFEAADSTFTVWIQGDCQPDWDKILGDFKAYTEASVAVFGDFPSSNYHYLFQILPHKFYHGVEHQHSTVITLGPAHQFHQEAFYDELLGVSCHELFHTWNVTRIRPKEMMPYDFTQENYFQTGFVAEGITTYYGDLLLKRSGVFSTKKYLREINKILKRHFENYGRFNRSLADSSYDLWLDGYKPGIPHRKVSIYVKGAIIALLLDLEIRHRTRNQRDLDDVMAYLWDKFGKQEKGYLVEDYIAAVNQIAGKNLEKYFEAFVYGTTPVEERLQELLDESGCTLQKVAPPNISESQYGFKLVQQHQKTWKVSAIAPGSPAHTLLALGDELVAINGKKVMDDPEALLKEQEGLVDLAFFRRGQLFHSRLEAQNNRQFYCTYEIAIKPKPNAREKAVLERWLGKLEG